MADDLPMTLRLEAGRTVGRLGFGVHRRAPPGNPSTGGARLAIEPIAGDATHSRHRIDRPFRGKSRRPLVAAEPRGVCSIAMMLWSLVAPHAIRPLLGMEFHIEH